MIDMIENTYNDPRNQWFLTILATGTMSTIQLLWKAYILHRHGINSCLSCLEEDIIICKRKKMDT